MYCFIKELLVKYFKKESQRTLMYKSYIHNLKYDRLIFLFRPDAILPETGISFNFSFITIFIRFFLMSPKTPSLKLFLITSISHLHTTFGQ